HFGNDLPLARCRQSRSIGGTHSEAAFGPLGLDRQRRTVHPHSSACTVLLVATIVTRKKTSRHFRETCLLDCLPEKQWNPTRLPNVFSNHLFFKRFTICASLLSIPQGLAETLLDQVIQSSSVSQSQ